MSKTALAMGDRAPSFDLPGVDGKNHSIEEFNDRKVLIVAFTCNHCPYVQAYEDRLIAIQRDYQHKGVALVAINSNETVHYPEDSFENMVIRAKEKGFNLPYLRDEDQSVAAAYGAVCTPEMFVFDLGRRLRYRGKIDDNWKEPKKVRRRHLREALDAILAGEEVAEPEVPAIGCSIKWA